MTKKGQSGDPALPATKEFFQSDRLFTLRKAPGNSKTQITISILASLKPVPIRKLGQIVFSLDDDEV